MSKRKPKEHLASSAAYQEFNKDVKGSIERKTFKYTKNLILMH